MRLVPRILHPVRKQNFKRERNFFPVFTAKNFMPPRYRSAAQRPLWPTTLRTACTVAERTEARFRRSYSNRGVFAFAICVDNLLGYFLDLRRVRFYGMLGLGVCIPLFLGLLWVPGGC